MFAKYNDNMTAVALGLYFLGIVVYVVQLLFMTEVWLKGEAVDVSAITVARVMGATWLGLGVGLLLTFINGPDGQKSFFYGLIVAQIATFIAVLNSYLQGNPSSQDDAIIVAILTLLLLFGWSRIRSRL